MSAVDFGYNIDKFVHRLLTHVRTRAFHSADSQLLGRLGVRKSAARGNILHNCENKKVDPILHDGRSTADRGPHSQISDHAPAAGESSLLVSRCAVPGRKS